jgi:hypothetical protein
MENLKQILNDLEYFNTIILDDLDCAVIGINNTEQRLVYSYDKIVEKLMNDGMSEDEAVEYVEFNIVRSIQYMGSKSPIIVEKIPQI